MISYEKLWKVIARKKLQPSDLCKLAGISYSTLRALQKSDNVRLDVLERICRSLNVDIGDICSFRINLDEL